MSIYQIDAELSEFPDEEQIDPIEAQQNGAEAMFTKLMLAQGFDGEDIHALEIPALFRLIQAEGAMLPANKYDQVIHNWNTYLLTIHG